MIDNPIKLIADDAQFEELCCAIAQFKYGDFDAQRYGRSGQKQWGVDIRATYKKANSEKIVIQCKFKNDPPKFSGNSAIPERKAIKEEIKDELKKALEGKEEKGYTFDYFVYASNIPRDTQIQEFAKTLCTDEYEVVVWSQADIEEDIYRYERLKQIYTLNGKAHGVEIINRDFIDTLKAKEEEAKPNISRYYTSGTNHNIQWYGILKNWDVIRADRIKSFIESITDSFSNEYIESRVGAIILGDGGSGKSVFLRRIAIEICENHSDIVVWWVTHLQTFCERDINTIDDNPQHQHLIFIEDWYRNVGKDTSYSNVIFNWLKSKNNVRVVIGDRQKNSTYHRHVTKRNEFHISLDENATILENIKGKVPALSEQITEILHDRALVNSSPIFIILFVLFELKESEITVNYDESNFENLFKELIGKKISMLEEDERYRGLGKGLFVSAVLYSDPRLNYFAMSEDALLLMSEFLGDNKEIGDRIKSNGRYPETCESLIRVEELTFKSGFNLRRIRFNHDLIAEKGISLISDTKYDLGFSLEPYEIEKLIEFYIGQNELNASLTLFIWLTHKFEYFTVAGFFNIFKDHLYTISGAGMVILLRLINSEDQKTFTREILLTESFFKLSEQIVSRSLNIWQNDDLGKQKAKEILDQEDFFKLPYQIVSHSLRIWQNDKIGEDKAKEILEQKNFLELPPEIISHALRIWKSKNFGKEKAKEILDQENFFELPFETVSHALRIRQDDKFGMQKAKEILNQKDFFKLPFEIVSHAFRILQNDDLGKEKAREILEQENFIKLSDSIVSHALKIWQNEQLGKDKAKEILEQENFFKLSFKIVSHSLRIWADEDLGREKATEILDQDNFLELPYHIVARSLGILGDDKLGKKRAKEILEQENFFKLPDPLVSHSLRIWQDEDLGSEKAEEILSQENFLKIPPQIITHALRIRQDDELGKEKAREILGLFLKKKGVNTFLIFNSIRILVDQESAQETIKTVYEKIISLRKDGKYGKLFFDLSYLPIFFIEAHRKKIENAIDYYAAGNPTNQKRLLSKTLKCFKGYPEQSREKFKIPELIAKINLAWRDDLDYQRRMTPTKVIHSHIDLALSNIHSKADAKKMAQEILEYCEGDSMLTQCRLFETAIEIVENDDFEFWGV